MSKALSQKQVMIVRRVGKVAEQTFEVALARETERDDVRVKILERSTVSEVRWRLTVSLARPSQLSARTDWPGRSLNKSNAKVRLSF